MTQSSCDTVESRSLPLSSSIIGLSKDETILISAAGDVVACRCRDSPYHNPLQDTNNRQALYTWGVDDPVAANNNDDGNLSVGGLRLCCDDDLSTQLQESAICSWNATAANVDEPVPVEISNGRPYEGGPPRGGLLGGAPDVVEVERNASPLRKLSRKNQRRSSDDNRIEPKLLGGGGYYHEQRSCSPSSEKKADPLEKAQQAFQSAPLLRNIDTQPLLDDENAVDSGSIVPIRSFDYSHFENGGNDMLPFDFERYSAPSPPSLSSRRRKSQQQAKSSATQSASSANRANTTTSDARPSSPRLQNTAPARFFHGVPTFLSYFQHVKITQVSAHPLGSHVLLASAAGLLYSYGLNDYGQLGIGVQTPIDGFHKGYILTPTIVTPLVENGGKVIACAAGVNHSLVVVATEERRVVKSASMGLPAKDDDSQRQSKSDEQESSESPRGISSPRSFANGNTETVMYHQVYGFGRNDSLKIGLVSPKLSHVHKSSAVSVAPTSISTGNNYAAAVPNDVDGECVILPRRVALRCKVRAFPTSPRSEPQVTVDHPTLPEGIFSIQASEEHSAALVRMASGDVELYTWGNSKHGALGLPQPRKGLRWPPEPPNSHVSSNDSATMASGDTASTGSVAGPSDVVPVPSLVAELSQSHSSTDDVGPTPSLLLRGEYPEQIALGRYCTFIRTSHGRCFSFGSSAEGMLGRGMDFVESATPGEISLPEDFVDERLTCVSAGATHVLATTEKGHVLAWGSKELSGLSRKSWNSNDESILEDNKQAEFQWSPQHVPLTSGKKRAGRPIHIVQAVAGYDSSVFVCETGHVLSCGKSSGRLGIGECRETVVSSPRPMFGGLQLWHGKHRPSVRPTASLPPINQNSNPPPVPSGNQARLKRGITIS